MTSRSTRRHFLEITGATAGVAAVRGPLVSTQALATAQPPPAAGTARPRVAALATVYNYLSHAYHIVGRFIDGFPVHDGARLHRPPFEIASLFIEQTPARDRPRPGQGEPARDPPEPDDRRCADARHRQAGRRRRPPDRRARRVSVQRETSEALSARPVLPRGARGLQSLWPVVPVFIDKHLSYSRSEASEMVGAARQQHVPLMAGSSLPVTWRLPPLEIPLGRKFQDVLVASRGDLEIFGFHALETLQCMAERRDRAGKPQGVAAVTCLEGDAVWEAGDPGVWSWNLLEHALARSHTVNPGDISRTRATSCPRSRPARRPDEAPHPVAFVVEYVDGLRGHGPDPERPCRRHDDRRAGSTTGRRRIDRLDAHVPARAAGRQLLQSAGPADRGLLPDRQAPLPCRAHAPDRRHSRRGPREPHQDHRADRRHPNWPRSITRRPADSGFIRTPLTDPRPNRL